MRKYALLFAVAGVAMAAPAQANEGRAEIRGGIAWAGGFEEAVAGVAGGYDWDLGETTFVGLEASADKILVEDADILFGATARAGVKVGANGKLFAAGGYSFGVDDDAGDAIHLGAGYQHKVSENVYLKAEYRHFFDDFVDVDTAAVGVGFAF